MPKVVFKIAAAVALLLLALLAPNDEARALAGIIDLGTSYSLIKEAACDEADELWEKG